MAYLLSSGVRLAVEGRPLKQGVVTPYPTQDLVSRHEADVGVTINGGLVTLWTDRVGTTHYTPVTGGTGPVMSTLDNGIPALLFEAGTDGMVGSIGSLPIGAEPDTHFIVMGGVGSASGVYGGETWGADATALSRGIVADGGRDARFDWRNGGFTNPQLIGFDTDALVVCRSYDGGTARMYINDVDAGNATIELATGTVRANLMRSWSGNNQNGKFAASLVYRGALSDVVRAQVFAYLMGKYLSSTTQPLMTGLAITGIGGTTMNAGWLVNRGGASFVALTATSAQPSKSNIESGIGMAGHAVVSAAAAGSLSAAFAGLTNATPYWLWGFHRDAFGNDSLVMAGGTGSTLGAAVPAVISISGVSAGTTSAVITWTTTKSGGNVSRLASANLSETAAFTETNGTPSAVLASGSQTVTLGGLTPGTSGHVHLAQRDSDNLLSNEAHMAYTTQPISSTPFDAVVSNAAQITALLNTWKVGGSAPITSPKTIGVDTSLSGTINLNYIMPHEVTIRPYSNVVYSSPDPFNPQSSIKMVGEFNMGGARKIRLYGWRIEGVMNLVRLHNFADVTIERCFIRGNLVNGMPATLAEGGCQFAMQVATVSGLTSYGVGGERLLIKDCLIAHTHTSGFNTRSSPHNDYTIIGCVFCNNTNDEIKHQSGGNGFKVINNWFARNRLGPEVHHEDGIQIEAITLSNLYVRGNFQWSNNRLWVGTMGGTNQALWLSAPQSPTGEQFLDNLLVEQNIFAVDNVAYKYQLPVGVNMMTRYNTGIAIRQVYADGTPYVYPDTTNYHGGISGPSAAQTDHNLIFSGVSSGGIYEANNLYVNQAGPNYAISNTHFEKGDVPRSDYNGTQWLDNFKHKIGTPGHWLTANPYGAYLRQREIWDQTYRYAQPNGHELVPGDVGWPVAPNWQRQFNNNNACKTTFTGNYDPNGNNSV